MSDTKASTLHDRMAAYVSRGDIPGIVTLVARRGEVAVEAIGNRAAGEDTPVARDTIFRLSSMTKPVAAAAGLLLVEEGKLRLDEPVDRLLPELANRKVLRSIESAVDDTLPAKRPISVRDLFTFTLGTGLVFAMPGTYPIQAAIAEVGLEPGPPSPQTAPPPDEWLRRLGALPLIHHPGEAWMYDTGSDVLGVLIARASGQTFDAFLRERLFEPLGMKDTGFFVPAAKIDRFATSYVVDSSRGMQIYDPPGGQWSEPPAFPSGSGGLVSTVDDMYAFSRLLLDGGVYGGKRLLAEATVRAMTRDQLTAEQRAASAWLPGYFDNHGWGWGTGVITGDGDDSGPIGAFGWDGGMGTSWRVDPGEQMVTILMTQRMWESPVAPPVCHEFWQAARGMA